MRFIVTPETKNIIMAWAKKNPAVVRVRVAGGLVGLARYACDREVSLQLLPVDALAGIDIYRDDMANWELELSRVLRCRVDVSLWGAEELSEDFQTASELVFEDLARVSVLTAWQKKECAKSA